MADGHYRFQQGAGQHYFQPYSHHTRHLQQRPQSPTSAGRNPFSADTPSPSRSPGAQSPAYNMYNQSHTQGQHAILNGASHHQYRVQMAAKPFQHQTHLQHAHQHQHQQEHTAHATHTANYSHHQHNHSGGNLTSGASHFTSTQIQNGTTTNAYIESSKPVTEHWAKQIQQAQQEREMTTAHPHARNSSRVTKNVIAGSNGVKEPEKEERSRIGHAVSTDDHLVWSELDMGGSALKTIAPTLFNYTFLTHLYLNNNRLTSVPPIIRKLKALTVLNLSINNISELPAEIGMLVNLKELLLYDNHIETLPFELGNLYQLNTLGIVGNPLNEDLLSIIKEEGTSALVKYLRENAPVFGPPNERDWVIVDESETPDAEKFTVLSYNILCDKAATPSQYGYTPTAALVWEQRREVILKELRSHDADIICLQEVDQDCYNNFLREALAHNDYKGVFWPRTRSRTMVESQARWVDGCATFYKNSKFVLLDKQLIDFAGTAITRPDMKGEHDVFNRIMTRDNIAVVSFFENRLTGSRLIVSNTHTFWDEAYKDVKLVQVAIMMEQISKIAQKYANWPAVPEKDKVLFRYSNGDKEDGDDAEEVVRGPVPSLDYTDAPSIPMIVCGDFNSTPGSGIYNLITQGSLENHHQDLGEFKYGLFTRDGMKHPFALKSSYSHINELQFTNYTPGFSGVLDYIFYSTNTLQVRGLLGEVDGEYLQRVPGFPNYHFPSDHLALLSEFSVKPRKDKPTEANFGPQKERRS
ncbi:transcription factor [Trichodelitschia bisporula]|uniref:CCR4-Not complex 3'-5'-exoribonuclease subunit Ccr4 n=1 Tax=Trichodelitschia bisporula TaxID=703511 RepID=A0A6G1HVZ9_9PEZI|nr:transcription factor [Trichodelitschia bisporula]